MPEQAWQSGTQALRQLGTPVAEYLNPVQRA
jgi:hypothetical protein